MIKFATRAGVLVAALGLVVACSSSGKAPQKVVTITVPPSGPASSAASQSPGAATSGSTSATPSTARAGGAAADVTRLDGTCDTLLSHYQVADAIGAAAIRGKDAFVVGVPEKAIGRRAYLNCRYGVTGTGAAAAAAIEIGVSLYTSPAEAAERVSDTAADYTSHGARDTHVAVGGQQAQLLSGGTGDGYTDPLLVVADGQRTVAVTVAKSFATGPAATKDATALAELALKQTAA